MILYTDKKEALVAFFDGTHEEIERTTKRQVSFVIDHNQYLQIAALANMSKVSHSVIFRKFLDYCLDDLTEGFDQETNKRFIDEFSKAAIADAESEAK